MNGNMKNALVPFAFGVMIAFLLFLLPIYPLWAEGRQITQAGESLYHELQFVSMHAYYEYARYAQTAWSEATKVVYVLLAIVNPLVLLSLSWLATRVLRKWRTR